jgi:hypothetical protein
MTTIALRSHTGAFYTTLGQTKTIVIPGTTLVNDLMLLHWSGTQAQPDSTPTGWTPVQAGVGGTSYATLYYKIAVAGDIGATVTVPGTANSKTALTLEVYSNTSTLTPIAVSAISLETAVGVTHTGPALSLPGGFTGYVAQFLSLKDTSTAASTTITGPSGYPINQNTTTAGTSAITSVAADSSADVTTYTTGVFTVNAASGNATVIVVALNGTSATTVARPTSDITTTGWAPSTGTTVFPLLADDDPLTYAEGANTNLEVKFGTLSAPPTSFVYKGYDVGGTVSKNLVVQLRMGTSTIIATLTITTIDSAEAVYRYTLTSSEKAACTNLADLRLRLVPSVS